MKWLAFAVLLLEWGCSATGDTARAPPFDRFYYPTGLAHARPNGGDGVLYVASGNYDKRYRSGSLIAVDLDAIGVPALGTPVPASGPIIIEDLAISETASLEVANFVGEIRQYPIGGVQRLFMASRAEENRLHVVDATGTDLVCFADPETRDCGTASMDLTSLAAKETGRPQARGPVGVGISAAGDVIVTHQASAKRSDSNELGDFYVVRLSAADPVLNTDSFIRLKPCMTTDCEGGSQGVAVGARYAYVTGKIGRVSGTQYLPGNLLRWVDLSSSSAAPRVDSALLEFQVQQFEGRGIALRADESRLYMVTRGIDTLPASGPSILLAVDVFGPSSDAPNFRIVQTAILPERCDEVRLIERGLAGDLVVITCSDAGAVLAYDALQAQIVSNVRVGSQAFALAVDARANALRVFVANFTDGQVDVLDMPDTLHPEDLHIVARLGKSQRCIVRSQDPACQGAPP